MFHVNKTTRELFIDDEIGKTSTGRIGHETIAKGLTELGKGPIKIRLASLGGDLLEGYKMLETLRRHSGQITVTCDATVASAATLFLTEPSWIREASATCQIMIHRVSSGMIGNAIELRELADVLERYDRQLVGLYSRVTDLTEDELLAAMTAETYFTAEQAAAIGFVDRVVGLPVDAKKTPKLAKAMANMKRMDARLRDSLPAVAASASESRLSPGMESKVQKIMRQLKAERLARQGR